MAHIRRDGTWVKKQRMAKIRSMINGVGEEGVRYSYLIAWMEVNMGLTEKTARERGRDVRVGKFPWIALGKARILGATEGFVKIVGEAERDEILGAHIIGPHATDLIAEACVAMKARATVDELIHTIHAHPTLAEGVQEAAHGVRGSYLHI